MTIPINPAVPAAFWYSTRDEMNGEALAWWGKVFILETPTDQVSSGAVFSVYRCDRCYVPGPTRHGTFLDLGSAKALAHRIGDAMAPTVEIY